jgi:hypothetical protein
VLDYRNNNYKLEPRNAGDVVSGPAILLGFGPQPAFIRTGVTGNTIPTALTVSLSHVETTDTTVTITSGTPADLTVNDVVVPMGQLSAAVPVTGINANAAVTLTASLNGSMKTATVRVLDGTEVPQVIAVTPANGTVTQGTTVTMGVKLDLPPVAGTDVTLAINPATGFGTVPAMVTVAADQLTGNFSLVADAAATGTATVTATLGASTASTMVTAQGVSTAHVVISEIAVKGPGASGGTNSAGDELVELYNPTSQNVDIGGWKIQYKSATGTAYQDKATIPGQTVMAPHSYYLVASSHYTGTVAADLKLATDFNFAATDGHVRLGDQNVTTAKVDAASVDFVGYGTNSDTPEGGTRAPAVPTGANAYSIERKALPNSTQATMQLGGADATAGNGYDSDKNGDDWVLRVTRDPQNAASPTEP